jgi:hypothetical protein
MPDRDAVHLEPDSAFHEGEPKPFKLRLNPCGSQSFSAAFTEAELRLLRDQIDAALAAPYRVLILGGVGVTHPGLETAIRGRLDMLHAHHPRMEIATRCMATDADERAEEWAADAQVRMLFYDSVAAMVADGGNRALIVRRAGEDDGPNWDANVVAHQARICTDWVSLVEPAAELGEVA